MIQAICINRAKKVRLIRLAWIIHESRLLQLQGTGRAAVVPSPQTACNEADAVRSARSKSKKC